MKKIKYVYNPETLNYEIAGRNWKRNIWFLIGWICSSIVFGLVAFLGFSKVFQNPNERLLQSELKQMVSEYEIALKDLTRLENVLIDLRVRDENLYRIAFEAEPIANSVRDGGVTSRELYSRFQGYSNSEVMIALDSTIRKVKQKLYIQSVSYDELEDLVKNNTQRFAQIPAIQPIDLSSDKTYFSSGFGYRIHPVYRYRKLHTGCDFTAPKGTKVYATGNGKVIYTEMAKRGYGYHIIVDHGFGYETLYGHLSAIDVRVGQSVKRGEVIGKVGNTGLSTGPHLHYEVWKNGTKIDPINFFHNDLSPEEYTEMLRLSETITQSFD